MKVDTAQRVTQWCWRTPTSSRYREPLRPDLTDSRTRCCKPASRGSRAPTASHQSRSGVVLGEARNEPRSRKLPQSDSEEEAQTEPQPKRRNHSQGASGENQRRNRSQRACGEKNEVKQQGYEDREKNIEDLDNDERNRKSKANSRQKSKANSRQDESRANGRQKKIIANSRQSEPKDGDRDKAKYAARHITEESCSQPVPKHPRTDSDVQQEQ